MIHGRKFYAVVLLKVTERRCCLASRKDIIPLRRSRKSISEERHKPGPTLQGNTTSIELKNNKKTAEAGRLTTSIFVIAQVKKGGQTIYTRIQERRSKTGAQNNQC